MTGRAEDFGAGETAAGLRVIALSGPATVQDAGRPGYLARGLSRGGAADRLALAEGAALLGQDAGLAALEMAGAGGRFEAQGAALAIALTGAPMAARLDGRALAWNASHRIEPGQLLEIGPARQGVYGYLHLAGGIATEPVLGSRSAHLVAGIGGLVEPGALLPAGPGAGAGRAGRALEVADRFRGGTVRVIAGFQTPLFDADTQARFAATRFRRGARASRMGVALEFDGAGFTARGQLDILSEMIVPGDIQMTGDGRPFVLLTECQTTGGYPRIGAVIPADLALVAQAPPGAALRFAFVDRAAALEAEARHRAHLAALPGRVRPLLRDPADMPDLLAQQLVGGVVSALDDPFADPRSRPEPERSEP